jgi:hypothetical protein
MMRSIERSRVGPRCLDQETIDVRSKGQLDLGGGRSKQVPDLVLAFPRDNIRQVEERPPILGEVVHTLVLSREPVGSLRMGHRSLPLI